MASRGSHSSGGYENGIAVEEAIIAQLKELNLVGRRKIEADERDTYELGQVYDQVRSIIQRDTDMTRKSKLEDLVDPSEILRQLILFLRGWQSVELAQTYCDTAVDALMKVTELTYDVDHRKAAIVLGVVEAAAELLVLEVDQWGAGASMEQQHVNGSRRNERREVRKQIASVLTNLTFGSPPMKRLVADYEGFMDVVIEIIEKAPNLVPPYSNLLRNVSWPTCKGMNSLFNATPALTKAAVEAHRRQDEKSVKSTLSAIWNMVGSGGEECVRRVVETDGFVDMLIQLLSMDAQRTLVVEYSTGILKYASAELVRGNKLDLCSPMRARLLHRLLPLLRASSMTIVKNALCAINEVAAKDPVTVGKHMNNSAMESLEKLQRSNDNDIRRPAKAILSRIVSGEYGGGGGVMSRSAHVGNGREMSASMRTDRLLPRRSPYCQPAGGGGGANGVSLMEAPLSSSHRASSLPRHFNEGVRGGGGMSSSLYGGAGGGQYTMGSPSPLYGNMDTIRAAQQQAQHQQQLMHVQQRRQLQQQAPPHYGCPPPHPIPEGFPLPTAFTPSHSFPSTSFAPPLFSKGLTSGSGGGGQEGEEEPFGANGPPTLQVEREEREGEGGEEYDYDDDEDELSTQVTRSGSIENIDEDGISHDISGFQSNVETANNSCRLSPVSYSDLPDSPTQCAALRDKTVQLSLPSYPIASSTFVNTLPFGAEPHSSSDGSSGGLSSSQTHSSHTTPHATSAEQTPTYSSLNAHYTYDSLRVGCHRIEASAAAEDSAPSTSHDPGERGEEDDDDDYGVYEEDILDRSIQEALPQRIEEKRDRLDSFLLDSISSALPSYRSPSSKSSSRYSNTSTLKEDDILAAAIESAMPKIGSLSSPRGTMLQQPKNGVARWSKLSTTTTTEGQKTSEQRGEGRKEEEESEESDYEGDPMGGSLVGTMPRDVEEEMEAERIAIDCSSLKRKPRPTRTSFLPRQMATPTSTRTTRQATPTSNGRPSSRPSSIGRPRPLTSTPASSKSRLSKFPSTPLVSAVTLSGTPNGNSHPEATPPPSTNGKATPTTTSSASLQATSSSTSLTMSRLKKPTASAVVPPYNYQIPKSSPRCEKESNSRKGGKEGEKSANGQMLVTTV